MREHRVLLVSRSVRRIMQCTLLSMLIASYFRAQAGEAPCGESTGPDIIVGSINSVVSPLPFNGIDAFSFGATYCNVGDDEVEVVSNTNNHPVWGQNMYRIKDGRFEQLGMSWMLHSFVALAQNGCSCGCIAVDAQHLGVGCSIPESATIQGSGDLGPRYEINPTTGYFNYPSTPGTPIEGGFSIYRRTQVRLSDLDPALNLGANYFVEGIVIAPDDAAAGNSNNNASYRPLAISLVNGNAVATLTGQTTRGLPALFAWRDNDPEVLITEVHVPDDGTFFLGAKATSVGDGAWQYEYALYNLNSDRAAGAFSVPRPSDVVVEELGFHDVDYHSGEPYDLTDWPSTIDDESVRWSTTTFDINPNANALRWGTLYNFRFRTNRAPTDGSITLGLFKPGPMNSVQIPTIVPNPVIADYDEDGDLDLADHSHWSACATRPNMQHPAGACAAFDIDVDHDNDLHDFRAIMNSFGNESP